MDTSDKQIDGLHTGVRERALELCKDFKTSWVQLGQTLYAVYEDKLYHGWGYEKFEHYTQKELGFKKQVAMKMLRSYLFLEEDEPAYLREGFTEPRKAPNVPSLDAVNVLRMAKGRKELLRQDYNLLKRAVFDKGKDASVVRKDLAAIMKERKPVDPQQEREERNTLAIRKLIGALSVFQKDAQTLKMVSDQIVEESKGLLDKLKKQLP